MSRHSFLLQHSDIENYVMTEKKTVLQHKHWKKPKMPKRDILACFQAHFTLGLQILIFLGF